MGILVLGQPGWVIFIEQGLILVLVDVGLRLILITIHRSSAAVGCAIATFDFILTKMGYIMVSLCC